MIYKIGLIIAGLIITGIILIILLGLSIIGIENQRDIIAEEYQKMYDELEDEQTQNHLNE